MGFAFKLLLKYLENNPDKVEQLIEAGVKALIEHLKGDGSK